MTTSNADERRSPRTNVLLSAAVEAGGASIPVRVRNLSAHGVLVKASGLAAGETQVLFRCNGVAVPGWIVWAKKDEAGIQFGQPVKPEDIAKKKVLPGTKATIRDTRNIDVRRPGFRGNQLTAEQRKIVDEWIRGAE